MNIILVGSGGREHTLAWKLQQSPQCSKLFIAPGNAGTAGIGTNLDIKVTEFEKLGKACIDHKIDMLVVGPEEPLVKGIYDYFKKEASLNHIRVIGPSAEAAQLEGSKAYAKAFMQKNNIPTAAFRKFTAENYEEGLEYIKAHPLPIVLKADGLAAGKGVLICKTYIEAVAEFELMILRSKFGEAGKTVVVEQFLEGIEISVFALTDGKDYVLLPEAKDYKRVGEGDTGLNTGGMGAVSPVPFFDSGLKKKVVDTIVEPTIKGLAADNLDYKGFVFIGLMISDGEPYVIEYNCRMGDPETEVVMTRFQSDLVEALVATAEGRIGDIKIEIDPQTVTTVVAVSGGYPGDYEKGKVINGLDTVEDFPDSIIFHAGTTLKGEEVVTNGGRVLAVTSKGLDVRDAVNKSKDLLMNIYYEGIHYRHDIGYEFIGS
ncbi:MAG: phosphoribosylamine--glycine ligase [Ferruginibacter sp.]